MSTADVLVLPARVDADASAALWRALGGSAPAAIDFAAVREIDSAGLALVAELSATASTRPELRNVPARFAQLCAAHRIDKELSP